MTEIEQYQPASIAVRDHQAEAVARLSEWASSAQAAMVVAEQLSRSSFVPESFRNKPGEATAAILAGLEVGLQPMAALRSFDVIQGQAAPRAVTLRAILQSHGHEVELVESTATRAKMRGRRRGATRWQDVTWTMDRARQLGLASKNNWKAQPQAMLVARATSEIARLVASDAILGIAYSAEEIADGAGAGVEVSEVTTADPSTPGAATTPAGTKRMSRRKRKVEPDGETPLTKDDGVVDAEVVESEPHADAAAIQARIDDLAQEDRDDLGAWWKGEGIPPLKSGDLTDDHVAAVSAAIDAYTPTATPDPAARNKKMWAMVAEAWPDESDDDRDELRRTLIGVVAPGVESSKDLTADQWSALFDALDQIKDGERELFLRATGDYELRRPAKAK